ncbi:MAG: 1-(5-phosphoribosyl)-5-[(5-phosphoribosylamino)methylideneamino]imidazole-4-carboxamide isomerase [Spirochaetes bacterium]|nr:1-(5-phosphoribosyl)-5-[(5-phosphoribosylamino)methylideneamino]imidazole-4-carboxamide isomerase [Spirochaetota bacterium]
MLIIPAIDILGGKCVRLYKGDYSKVTVYNDDAVAVAAALEAADAKRIHIVDLDAARGKGINNRKIISNIRKKVKAVLELGGGIRSEEDISELLSIGIDRLILGTVFAREPEKCLSWIKKYGGSKFIAGIDALNGEVRISGWEEGSGLKDSDLAKKAAEAGFCSIIYTNISRDGTLSGPDTENTKRIAEESGLPVIVSGGISCEDDFQKITQDAAAKGKIAGIITGKAFYDGKFDLASVIKKYQKNEGTIF